MKQHDVDYLWWDGFLRGLPLDQARRFPVAKTPSPDWFYNWSRRLGIRVARLTAGKEIVLVRVK
jgi:hypothetical protein